MELRHAGRRRGDAGAWTRGRINRVTLAGELMGGASAMGEDILANAPLSISALKEMALKTETLSLEDTLSLPGDGGLEWYDRVRDSEDAKEGPLAFAEKRAPVWRGR